MAKVSPIQGNFNGGELSPLLYGRPDLDKYKTGLQTCLNFTPLIQGPIERRPGTPHIVAVKTSSKSTRVIPFEFSTEQAYIIETGDLYMRFIKDNGQIESGGSPVELTTTYLEADLFQLKYTQSADVLYITHKAYPPRKIERTSDTDWTITDITFLDGPYLNTNASTTTLSLSGTTGSVTVTASAVTGINNNTGFQTTDIGRLIRWKDAAGNFTYLTITARASTTSVTATIDGPDASATTATVNWRLGLWSETTGFPAEVTFHQDRLMFGGGKDFPQRMDGSRTADFENMAPTEPDGTVVDDNAITSTLSSDQVNAIQWMQDDEKGLVTGTTGGEWVTRPSDTGGILTPGNIQSKRSSAFGSDNIPAIRAGRAVLFVQRAGRKVRELAYVFEDDGFRAPDTTIVAEHITRTGIVDMAYQAEPQSILWCCLTDGTLIGLTYERDQSIVGWHRHVVGGWSDAGNTIKAKVESVAVIPNALGTADELYIVVNRWINGATVRYIEYMEAFWDAENDPEDAFFVDSGLTLDSPIVVTGVTKANPAVATTATHGFSNGDEVRFVDVVGMTDINRKAYLIANKAATTFELVSKIKLGVTITAATQANPVVITAVAHGLSNSDEIAIYNVAGMTQLNGLGFTVANVTDDTFELTGVDGTGYSTFTSGGDIHLAINSTTFNTYISGGEVRERTLTLTGLSHLEGQTVSILSEGATHPDQVVSSGSITLNQKTSKAHVGLAYTSDAETLRPDSGAKDGTAQGKLVRIHRVILRFFQTLGGLAGPTNTLLDHMHFRAGGDPMDTAVPLYTGDIELEWDGEYSSDEHVYVRQDQPLPMTLEAVMPQMSTQDR
tara:strand:+ start:656 stop:3175 length:2520 start_codon:yes stop_codon:yes gene_type:complete